MLQKINLLLTIYNQPDAVGHSRVESLFGNKRFILG